MGHGGRGGERKGEGVSVFLYLKGNKSRDIVFLVGLVPVLPELGRPELDSSLSYLSAGEICDDLFG